MPQAGVERCSPLRQPIMDLACILQLPEGVIPVRVTLLPAAVRPEVTSTRSGDPCPRRGTLSDQIHRSYDLLSLMVPGGCEEFLWTKALPVPINCPICLVERLRERYQYPTFVTLSSLNSEVAMPSFPAFVTIPL
jgi:hypothetical protein